MADQVGTYKTLLKSDLEYKGYLQGTFSKNHVAIPIESFGVGSNRERTTFLILPQSNLQRPSWVKIYLKSIRPELLGLTLGHTLVALLFVALVKKQFVIQNWMDLVLVLMATVMTHASACLFNDYFDHMNGTDRRSISHGSQVIQKAWSRAIDVRRWAILNAALAVVVGLVLMWGHFYLFLTLASASALAILFYSGMTPFWNKLGAGDFWITLLFGPLLFFSVWVSVLKTHQGFFEHGLLLSMCFGLLASWTIQIRQFQDIFKREKGSFRTLISRMSFDQAKKFLQIEGSFFLILQPLIFWLLWPKVTPTLTLLLGALCAVLALTQLRRLVSPLSSSMLTLTNKALILHGGFLFLWAGALCLYH